MSSLRERGERLRQFIVENVSKHPSDIARVTAKKFGITRQAVGKHLTRLVKEMVLVREGNTRNCTFSLCPSMEWTQAYNIADQLEEDVVWREDIEDLLKPMPNNVLNIWHYGFTEIFNNAIDHSEGSQIHVQLERTAADTQLTIWDDGVGIFKKIQKALGLLDERHAILELAKGKLTTDPSRHTGEGIFFASRMFDDFAIMSRETYFSHDFGEAEDWILQTHSDASGTYVRMRLNNHTSRTTRKVFDKFSSGEDYGFNKTVVPVRLAQYGEEMLISRSQAKRLLARVERFSVVQLDFKGIDAIGQAFADEVFRVFPAEHPNINIYGVNATARVEQMISRAQSQSTS